MLTKEERKLAIKLIKRAAARQRALRLQRALLKLAKEHDEDEEGGSWIWPDDTTRLRLLLLLLGGSLGALGADKLRRYFKEKYDKGLELEPASNIGIMLDPKRLREAGKA